MFVSFKERERECLFICACVHMCGFVHSDTHMCTRTHTHTGGAHVCVRVHSDIIHSKGELRANFACKVAGLLS